MNQNALKLRIALLLIAVSTVSAAAAGFAHAQQPGPQAVAVFVDAVRDYASMHRRLERAVGRIEISSTVEEINRSMTALAAAIRAERPAARQGDLFTPALGREFRTRINNALLEHGFTAADVYRSEHADRIDPYTVRLQVNGTFPWVLGAAMFPCVIEALPPLPPELQYRIVGNDLVLIDVHASLIVDILPHALADDTF